MENNKVNVKELPFAGYIMSLDKEDARQLKRSIELRCGFSEATSSRYLRGLIRPDMLKRREIASMIRKHSGNKEWTGDNLFPVEFYRD